jgi:hypothetical protein
VLYCKKRQGASGARLRNGQGIRENPFANDVFFGIGAAHFERIVSSGQGWNAEHKFAFGSGSDDLHFCFCAIGGDKENAFLRVIGIKL